MSSIPVSQLQALVNLLFPEEMTPVAKRMFENVIAEVGDDHGVTVGVTTSDGADGAVLVMVDTTFEPNGSDGGPGLRILVNDAPAYEGVAYVPAQDP